ncbi:hypothetical protein LB505_000346 [Fusarium chuoi]|nr:hypothetical protein LB505_000346 [Fusarium chuoi]
MQTSSTRCCRRTIPLASLQPLRKRLWFPLLRSPQSQAHSPITSLASSLILSLMPLSTLSSVATTPPLDS